MRTSSRQLLFSVAALFCVVAVILRFAGTPVIVPVLCLALAAVALILGLRDRAQKAAAVDQPVVFTQDQVAQLKEMKSRGQTDAAIRQAQLWSRGANAQDVVAAVEKL